MESITIKGHSDSPPDGLEISSFRRFLPQFLCTFPMSLLMANIGIVLSYSTIAVQEFLYPRNNTMPKLDVFQDFTMDKDETTIFVSLAYLCQPVGSILGGILIGRIGRKNMVLLFNLPLLVGWLLIFFSRSSYWLYFASVFLGIGLGCGEAPVATYVPEIAQPSHRGFLFCKTQMFISLAFLAPYLVFMMVPSWRWSALILTGGPILTFMVTLPIPDSPYWLVSKGRIDEAVRALRILRGWVPEEMVKDEIRVIIQKHKEQMQQVGSTFTLDAKSTEVLSGDPSQSLKEKLHYAFSPRILRPFGLIFTMFLLMYVSGYCWMRPYLVPVLKQLLPDKDPEHFATMLTVTGLVGGISSMIVIRYIGKRWLYLSSLLVSGLSCLLIYLVALGHLSEITGEYSIHGLSFMSGFGVIPLPWMMQGDLYPFRARGIASGVGAAVSYLVGFICTGTFLKMLSALGLGGVFLLCAGLNALGALFLYFKMPETEGKSLEEIDEYYKSLEKDK